MGICVIEGIHFKNDYIVLERPSSNIVGAIMIIDKDSVAKDDALVDHHEASRYKEGAAAEPFKGRSIF
jgi:hypothetical protein